MIEQREIEGRTATLAISTQHVERDYVLNHILAAISEDPEGLVFRGGTALARVYWPDFRISEDLDFVSPGTAPSLERQLQHAIAHATRATGLDLELRFGGLHRGRSRSFVRWRAPWEAHGELLIDVVTGESASLPVERRPLVLPYSDLAGTERSIPVLDLAEIMANKWLMLDDRAEPRDLFDLWWGLTRGGIRFEDLANAHRARYGYRPMARSIERAHRLERPWAERLSHQVAVLPDFEDVLVAVEEAFRSWAESAVREEGETGSTDE